MISKQKHRPKNKENESASILECSRSLCPHLARSVLGPLNLRVYPQLPRSLLGALALSSLALSSACSLCSQFAALSSARSLCLQLSRFVFSSLALSRCSVACALFSSGSLFSQALCRGLFVVGWLALSLRSTPQFWIRCWLSLQRWYCMATSCGYGDKHVAFEYLPSIKDVTISKLLSDISHTSNTL